MKKLVSLALFATLFCVAPALAAVYTDSSINYPDGWSTGSNGGEGFGQWTLTSVAGTDGWAGGGIWGGAAAGVTGDVLDVNSAAFCFIGKGEGFSFTATRDFRAALAPGDSFEFDMAVNWDCGYDLSSLKGIVLLAGAEEVVKINHDAYPGAISVNGFTNNATLAAYGTNTMHWTITATDATTLTVTGTARDGTSPDFTTNLTVASTALTGFRLQSARQVNENHDERQTYFNNFKLTIAAPLPEVHNLTIAEDNGTWAVSNAAPLNLSFTVTRDTSEGAVEVSIRSSDSEFVALGASSVTLEEGVTSASFTATAQMTGSANVADITISATGYNAPAAYTVKGPSFRLSAANYILIQSNACDFWMNWDASGAPKDNSLVTLESDPAGALALPQTWEWVAETDGSGSEYVASQLTGTRTGGATLRMKYDGVQVADYGFTILKPGVTVSGPATLAQGTTKTYTVAVTVADDAENAQVSFMANPSSAASVDSATKTVDLVNHQGRVTFNVTGQADSGTFKLFGVVFQGTEEGPSGSMDVTAVPATAYIDYDDTASSDYESGFNFEPTPRGSRGFGHWVAILDEGDTAGIEIANTVPHENLNGILENGRVFAIYAYGTPGNNAEYSLYRPFGGDLAAGQTFSMDIGTYYRDGTKYFKIVREWEGAYYPRFQFYVSGDSYNVTLEGVADPINLGWEWADARIVHLEAFLSADGSAYTFTLTSGTDSWSTNVPTATGNWGDGLQGLVAGVYNGGEGDANKSFFNRLGIVQTEDPVAPRVISWGKGVWNPDGMDAPYEFQVDATTEDIGNVELTVLPADASVQMDPHVLDMNGATSRGFTLTILSDFTNETFQIVATPADTTVAPITYNCTWTDPYVSLSSSDGQWCYTNPPTTNIGVELSFSPSRDIPYQVSSSDPNVLVPSVTEMTSAGRFEVAIVGRGVATISVTNFASEVGADYTFTIVRTSPKIGDGGEVTITSTDCSFKLPDGFTGVSVRYATGLIEGTQEWNWQVTTDVTVSPEGVVTINSPDAMNAIFEVTFSDE